MSDAIRAPKTRHHLDLIGKLITGELPSPPIATLIGFRIVAADLGRTVFELDTTPAHANPMGTLHGGVVCDLVDGAMGCAMATSLEADETFTTLDLTTKFFKPVWRTRLTATARLTRRTRTLGFLECDVTDESGSVVAKAFSTCTVLRGADATGREVGR